MFDNTHFPGAKKIWHQGKLLEWSDPNVHSMSHVLHYGTSVFEGIRAYSTRNGPAVFRLPDHIARFIHSAEILSMEVPYSKEEIIEAIKLVMKENKLDSAYIRPLMYYSYGNLGLVPKFSAVELVIGAWEWGAYLGAKTETGVQVFIVPWKRVHRSQLEMTAKLGGVYVQSAICGIQARSLGYDEAVLLNLEGNIAEGPGENIFIIKDGVLITNDKTESILEGITRASLLEIAKGFEIETRTGVITKEDLFQADEAFFCGTAVEIAPIVSVTDGSNPQEEKKEYVIGSGKVGELSLRIANAYKDAVCGKLKEYEKWLTYVND
ncbi:MAG: branched-chain amino acid transaminase [Candidatus Aminicenantes bacterium]|jgi:branched-chain amino acid aminotransferase|nr:branched-chain amino acid transaminase [Candidatus Aminicenantes bacterium]